MKALKSFLYPIIACIFVLYGCKQKAEQENQEIAENKMFVLLDPQQTHVSFQNTLTEGLNTNILMYEYFYNGGGIAAGDFNNDGLVDLYFTSNMSDNKLYLNKGKMQFEDITMMSRAGGRPGPWKTGVNAIDINADGKLDIYLCYSGAMPAPKRTNQLFINMGNNAQGVPIFEDQAEQYGLASQGFSNQSYFFDYDKDGDLDMLLLNHNPKNLPILNVESTVKLFKEDNPEKGLRLFKNDGGKFQDVTIRSDINGSELSYGLGLGISDFNGDGWPDFYVSNDYAVPDYLYINNHNGTFTNATENSIGHNSQFSMGNDVADINNDGLTDIFTLDMLPEDNHRQKLLMSPDNFNKFDLNVKSGFYYQYMRNMLQLNNGNGSFSEIGQYAGISNTDWSWSALFADYDNDGWKDLFITNGYFRDYTNLDFINYMNQYVQAKGRLQREDVMEIIRNMPSSNVTSYAFQNKQGNQFEKANAAWGITSHSNSNGAVYADLDNDGDLDLVTNNINQPAFIYQNNSRSMNPNHYLQFKLSGEGSNTQGIGTKILIYSNGQVQTLEQNPARGYLSNVSYLLHAGLGKSDHADSIRITWANGKVQALQNVKGDQVLTISEKDAKGTKEASHTTSKWLTQVTPSIRYQDQNSSLRDFNRQSLLISEFSHHGPCIRKADLNGDGLEDLLIGGSAGNGIKLFLQNHGGQFIEKRIAVFEEDKSSDCADAAIADLNGDGKLDIYVASGGYHDYERSDSRLRDRIYLNTGNGNFTRGNGIPKISASKSCVAIDDINGDGAPDLFLGGRVIPGNYPEAPESFILINDGKGNFTDKTQSLAPDLSKPGMVTDAVWADLNGDKQNELIVVGEWMSIMIFQKENGRLVNNTNKFFDQSYPGWWNTLTVGDFNGDGKTDIIAGNLGLNTQFNASEKEPLEMFYKDFDNNGSVDPIFSSYIQHQRYPFITRDELVSQLPITRKRFADYKSYADITMENLFPGDELKSANHLTAYHMSTTLFLSQPSGKFAVASLPQQVQYSPVYTIDTLDFNGDRRTDLLVCGNNSRSKIRLGKFDANYGALLEGDGKGNFKYIPQSESGLNVWGDVRSCAQISNTIYFGINGKPIVAYRLLKK